MFDLADLTISERWSAPEFQKLRREYLEGKAPVECKRCQLEEKDGSTSLRMLTNAAEPGLPDEILKADYEAGPKRIVFRLSNICNLACRTCHGVDSSRYHAEGQHYETAYGERGNRYLAHFSRQHLAEAALLATSEKFRELREIEFFGGEPLLNRTHYALLRGLVAEGRAASIKLYYCTNGTI